MKRAHWLILALFSQLFLNAQDWNSLGNSGLNENTRFVGNTDNAGVSFRTHDFQRMRLYGTLMTNTINTFTNIKQNGYVGISNQPAFFSSTVGPFSRLHLADSTSNSASDYAQQNGYRPWMRNGITMTGNSDMGYIGQYYHGPDTTDMVIHWSNDPESGDYKPDHLRFIFTANYNSAFSTGAQSREGLEGMRLVANDMDEIFVGVGDWYAGNALPDERLDVLDRTVRIRRLVPDYEDDDLDKVVVTDDDGRLHWRDVNSIPGINDCDWTVQNAGTSGSSTSHDVYTAVGSSDLCPDKSDQVGIGTSSPAAKLHVYSNPSSDGTSLVEGVLVDVVTPSSGAHAGVNAIIAPASGSPTQQAAVVGRADNATDLNVGVRGRSFITTSINVTEACGLRGESEVTNGTTNNAYGAYGSSAKGGSAALTNGYGLYGVSTNGTNAYGVYGGASGGSTNFGLKAETWGSGTNYGVFGIASGSGNYAGYFNGDVHITGAASCTASAWTSDENLKENIQDITNALEAINALRPTTYEFDQANHPSFQFPNGLQRGLIAQEVAQVLPDLVGEETSATYTDNTGVEHVGETVKTLNYIGLIPMLIAAMQEQQVMIDGQSQRLSELEEALANCCASGLQLQGNGQEQGTLRSVEEAIISGDPRALSIQPNPFSEPPTVQYTLERAGRMQLIANSADGKHLSVLREAVQEAGEYQLVWDTNALQPGMYYLTLLLDGEPVVKKAVKVWR